MDPSIVLTLAVLATVLVGGFGGAWWYDRHLSQARPLDLFTPRFMRWGNPNLYGAMAAFVILQCGSYAGGAGEDGKGKACSPNLDIAHEGKVVRAKFAASCDPPPRSHHVHMELKHKEKKGQRWDTLVTRTSDEVPGKKMETLRQIEWVCMPGYWKTYVRITGTGPNGSPYSWPEEQNLGWGRRLSKKDCKWK